MNLCTKLQEMINLREGTLLDGTVKKLFPYGAQVRIGETNRR
jgi:small subunit ribosomal protein S1